MRRKQKLMEASKKKLALFLAMTLTATAAGNIYVNKKDNKIYAAETDTYYFAEGFGTGVDFSESNNSWDIRTNFASGVADSIKNDSANHAAIVENNHSGSNEPVIRLINGVQNADLRSSASDYRGGTAISNEKIKLKEDGQFSAKFTISMPDACVNTAQTGGEAYAREVGGDGIAFIITTTEKDNIKGQAGGGIGYYGVGNSIVVELDSYFNGAYCTFETSDTAYINWDYDNQIYSNPSNGYEYLWNVANSKYTDYSSAYNYGAYWDQVLNPNGYSQLPGSSVRRFDHVGVMLDGEPKEHVGISYLNGIKPNEISVGKYVNINNPSASTPSSSADCATRFADEGSLDVENEEVDNRLFTFWMEYDGENIYVSYANGDFLTAVRPSSPQISVKGDSRLAQKFANQEVNIGFTSAIGSSKANHTVHSVEFVNEYIPEGISDTEYTEKYYVETPDAVSDYITVSGKKYVLKESKLNEDISLGSSAVITDKSKEDGYTMYKKVDYSSNPLYPAETSCVRADGGTVLYQFYDKQPTYQVIYYTKSTTDGTYKVAEESGVFTGTLGSTVNITDVNASYATKYTPDYKLSTTKPQEDRVMLENTDSTYVIRIYYDPVEVGFTVRYWLKDRITGQYVQDKDATKVFATGYYLGDKVTITDVDSTYTTKYAAQNYGYSTSASNVTSLTLEDAGKSYYMDLHYDPLMASYKLNYHKWDAVKGDYVLAESSAVQEGYVGSQYTVTDVNLNYGTKYENYTVNAEKNETYSVTLNEAGKTYEMNVYYDPVQTGYKLNYHKLNPNTGKYEYVESTPVKKGIVGQTYSVEDADASYTTKYTADGYEINSSKNEDYTVTLEDTNETYEMNVYYDPVKTTYVTEYWLEQPDGTYKLQTDDTVTTKNVYAGTDVTAVIKDYTGYEHTTTDNTNEADKVKADGTTALKVYYNLAPQYTVKYYTETSSETAGAIKVGNKYYKLQENDSVSKRAATGTAVAFSSKDNETAGVNEGTAEVTETYKSYAGFNFSDAATVLNGNTTGILSRQNDVIIELFYDKKTTTYKEEYYVEVKDQTTTDYDKIIDGVKYELVETNTSPEVPIDSNAVVTDKSETDTFKNLELIPPTDAYPSTVDDIADDGSTVVYQIYNRKPEYTVKYYKETSADTEGAVKVGDKYYKLEEKDTEVREVSTGTAVTYAVKPDGTAGVKEDTAEAAETYKSYEGFTFSDTATTTNGKTTGTVSREADVVIELFYDVVKTGYKELYWVEDPNAESDYVTITVNGEEKKFVLSETNEIPDVDAGSSVTITDKSDDYANYELVEVEIPGYPSWVEGIKPDGSTTVHQIYVLKPTYQVKYYVEVSEKTDDTIEVDGKHYLLKPDETITKYASAKTLVNVTSNIDGTGVKEADTEVTGTFKKFDGYTFNQTATEKNGKGSGEVSSDNTLVIMILYDLDEKPEEPTTKPEEPTTKPEEPTTKPEEPTTPQPTTKPSSPVITGDSISMVIFILLICSGCTAALIIASKKKTDKE